MKQFLCVVPVVLASFLSFRTFADDAATTAPATITMHMQSIHPKEVLAELSKQTGVAIQVWPENLYEQQQQNRGMTNRLPISIDADFDQVTFWTALDKICAGANLRAQNMGNNQAITLQESHNQTAFGKRPQSVGPLATFVADSLSRNHTVALDTESPQVSRSCGVQIMAFVDPRIRMSRYQYQATIDTADDDTGKSIVGTVPSQSNWNDAYCSWMIQGTFIPLDYDPTVSHKLTTLKGSIRATTAAEIEKIEVDLASEGAEKEGAGLKVAIGEVKDHDRSMDVKVTIFRADMPKESFRQLYNKIFRDIKFQNPDGKTFTAGGGGGGGEDKLDYTMSFSYGDSEKPTKLVWELATRTEEIDLPFEFHDLPLP